jgi:hypothetical protein
MIDVTELERSVEVTYKDGDGNSASAVVIGEPLSDVEARAEEIAEAHNLKEKATETQ